MDSPIRMQSSALEMLLPRVLAVHADMIQMEQRVACVSAESQALFSHSHCCTYRISLNAGNHNSRYFLLGTFLFHWPHIEKCIGSINCRKGNKDRYKKLHCIGRNAIEVRSEMMNAVMPVRLRN